MDNIAQTFQNEDLRSECMKCVQRTIHLKRIILEKKAKKQYESTSVGPEIGYIEHRKIPNQMKNKNCLKN